MSSVTRLSQLAQQAIGSDTPYPLASGGQRARTYLDSGATTLALHCVQDTVAQFLTHQASTHTHAHFAAEIASDAYEWAHQQMLGLCQLSPSDGYDSVFMGSGTTAAMNWVAESLQALRPERGVILCSVMEHHSNDLPHRQHSQEFQHIALINTPDGQGALDLKALKQAVDRYGERINYVAVTAVSNVTGILNPIREMADIVHRVGAYLLVDVAQMAAHQTMDLRPSGNLAGADIVAFSGHKCYAPGSPGVVVARRTLLQQCPPHNYGGGMVEDVHYGRYALHPNPVERQEAGTPNIPGAIALGAAVEALQWVGLEAIAAHEQGLLKLLLKGLAELPCISVYGDTDLQRSPRCGVVAFNLRSMHHALLARILSDYFAIAVRNACFCAHPYVRELVAPDMMQLMTENAEAPAETLEQQADALRGMVRVSFGLYNTEADVAHLLGALREIAHHPEHFTQHYRQTADGLFQHMGFHPNPKTLFHPKAAIARHLG